MLRSLLLAMAALALAGCVSMTEPVSVGPDAYMLGLSARGGMTSDAELLAQTLRSAGTFCTRQGRRIEVQSTNSTGTQGWTPQGNQVMFRCVA